MRWIRGRVPKTPEQTRQDTAADDNYLAEHEDREGVKYDAMDAAQRDKYYVHPGLFTRVKQFFFGV